jgi:hypothetical protein
MKRNRGHQMDDNAATYISVTCVVVFLSVLARHGSKSLRPFVAVRIEHFARSQSGGRIAADTTTNSSMLR